MIDERELNAAVDTLLAFKGDLIGKRNLSAAGFSVKTDNGMELIRVFNACSRRAVAALGETDMDRLESLGELLLNHVRATRDGTYGH